jgi:hypothetical protein
MHPLTKNIETLLHQLSTKLPQLNINTHEKHWVSGSEILAWGTITEIDGTPIVAEQAYLWKYPVITTANHYRRLKRAYKANCIDGVKDYLEWINGLAKGKKIENQMQALMTIIQTIEENK